MIPPDRFQAYVDSFNHEKRDYQDIVKFFLAYARLEYALKRSGYLQKGRDGSEAKADLSGFAKKIAADPGSAALFQVGRYILDHPPATLILRDGGTEWFVDNREPSIESLFRSIANIRNNLFHGGKFPSRHEPDVSRDEVLLRTANSVINEVLTLAVAQNVAHFYNEVP